MVIQCTECNTRFRISDDKLKPGGIKVRCSKCRHIFAVMPPAPEPQPPQEEEIDFGDFNMKPAPEEPFPAPKAARPPAQAEEVPPAAAADSATSAPPPAQEDESEFAFEKTGSTPGPAEFDFEESGSAPGPVEFDFEESGSAPGPAEFDFEETNTGQGPAEFAFEESQEEDSLEFGFEEEAEDDATRFSFDEEDPFAETEKSDSWESETGSGAPADFDFGEEKNQEAEDDFDLSGMSFGEEDSPPSEREDQNEAVTAPQHPQLEEPLEERAIPAASKAATSGKEKKASKRSDSNRKGPLRGLLMFVLALLLVLCGVAGYFFWQNGRLDLTKIVDQVIGLGNSSAVQGQIRLSDLSGSYVSNREAGQLFVIRGKAVNDFSEPRSAIAVKGIIYSSKGKPLLQQTVFCGNPLSGDDLRTLPFARIEEKMNNQFGDSLSNLNIEPGKAIPFTIVFKNLPADLAEYTVEPVESKAGSNP